MTPLQKYLSPSDMARLRRSDWLTRGLMDGMSVGQHKSPHHGLGSSFRQHRAYAPGDDLRALDWKVFGKTDRLFIREQDAETNLRAVVLVDCGGSMGYRGAATKESKWEFSIRLTASLATVLLGQQDAVGLAVLGSGKEIKGFVPPRVKSSHLHEVIEALVWKEPDGMPDWPAACAALARRLRPRSLVIVVSDCMIEPEVFAEALNQFQGGRHELSVFQVLDREEADFPFFRPHRFRSLADQEEEALADSSEIRDAYLAELTKQTAALRAICDMRRADFVRLATDQTAANALANYLDSKRARHAFA